MLYLAEVQKQSKGFMGGSETKLQLLACQRNDQTWTALPKGETIVSEEVASFNDGSLVMVNLSDSRGIQGKPEPAGNQLTRILQKFSSVIENAKKEEEKIDQWKESLTYQSQLLNERQEEIDALFEEIEEKETQFKELDAKTQEVNQLQAEAENIKKEFEAKSKELEGAWEHLRGEQKRFDEQKDEIQSSGSVLDNNASQKIKELLNRFSSSKVHNDNFSNKFPETIKTLAEKNDFLEKEWEVLKNQSNEYKNTKSDLEKRETELENQKQELKDSLMSIETAKTQLNIQEKVLEIKNESIRLLNSDLAAKEELYELLSHIASGGSDVSSDSVDFNALENMPLSELEEIVNNLRNDLDRLVRFVNDQEEELTLQKQTIEELQNKINNASETEKINLESELDDEQEGYKILDKSLVGSRRNLLERESIFKQHLLILRRRQGIVDIEGDNSIDINPVLERLNEQTQRQLGEKSKLESQVEQINQTIQQMKNIIKQQESQQAQKEEKLRIDEENIQSDRLASLKVEAQLKIYEQIFNPVKDSFDNVQENLKEFEQVFSQLEQMNLQQNEALIEIGETLEPFFQG